MSARKLRLQPMATAPYASGERPGGYPIPKVRWLEGQEAWDSLDNLSRDKSAAVLRPRMSVNPGVGGAPLSRAASRRELGRLREWGVDLPKVSIPAINKLQARPAPYQFPSATPGAAGKASPLDAGITAAPPTQGPQAKVRGTSLHPNEVRAMKLLGIPLGGAAATVGGLSMVPPPEAAPTDAATPTAAAPAGPEVATSGPPTGEPGRLPAPSAIRADQTAASADAPPEMPEKAMPFKWDAATQSPGGGIMDALKRNALPIGAGVGGAALLYALYQQLRGESDDEKRERWGNLPKLAAAAGPYQAPPAVLAFMDVASRVPLTESQLQGFVKRASAIDPVIAAEFEKIAVAPIAPATGGGGAAPFRAPQTRRTA